MKSQRDSFFDSLYEIAKRDKDVILISADMGAPALDQWRENLPEQFINIGIAEANMIAVAAGLALSGKKPFCYAIMPFVTLRCYEAIKVNLCLMNLPVTLVGVGAGFSYDDSGPTHHATEDISIMRALPNLRIYNASDSTLATHFARIGYEETAPVYIRLDREVLPQLYQENGQEIGDGVALIHGGHSTLVFATGNMVSKVKSIKDVSLYDVWRLKPLNVPRILEVIQGVKQVITVEEHLLAGGLGSAIAEVFVDNGIQIPLKRIGIKDKYYYTYGGRKNIQEVAELLI